MGAPAAKEPLAPGTPMVLLALALGVFVIGNDFTALDVALPAIEKDFNVDVGSAQWVINAYALFFGLAIVTGGRLADMLGRRKIFFIGSALFAGFSLIGALAPSLVVLVLSRVGMAFGGALMWPAILGMTYAALPASRAALAGGLILGVAGISNAVGPLLGGALTDLISWRAIFFLNVPVAAIAVLVTAAKLHQPEERQKERIDYAGIVMLSLSLLLLLLALDQGVDWGFGDPRIVGMFAGSAMLFIGFAFVEPRMGTAALVPKSVIRNSDFAAASAAVLLMSAVFFVIVLYVPQYLIKVLDYSALEAGAGLLPMMIMFALTSFSASGLYDRFGPKIVISAGAVALVVGTFLLSLIGDDASYSSFVPGLLIAGFGVGLFYSSVTTISLDDALEGVADRFDSKDFAWIVMAIRIQRQVGGNLAELLDTVAGTIREREYMRRQVAALAAEGKLSAWVLGGLPPAFMLYLFAAKRDYVMPMFTEPLGWLMLGGAVTLLSVGVFWMSRLVKVEV